LAKGNRTGDLAVGIKEFLRPEDFLGADLVLVEDGEVGEVEEDEVAVVGFLATGVVLEVQGVKVVEVLQTAGAGRNRGEGQMEKRDGRTAERNLTNFTTNRGGFGKVEMEAVVQSSA
jgi:hypothetical protein